MSLQGGEGQPSKWSNRLATRFFKYISSTDIFCPFFYGFLSSVDLGDYFYSLLCLLTLTSYRLRYLPHSTVSV